MAPNTRGHIIDHAYDLLGPLPLHAARSRVRATVRQDRPHPDSLSPSPRQPAAVVVVVSTEVGSAPLTPSNVAADRLAWRRAAPALRTAEQSGSVPRLPHPVAGLVRYSGMEHTEEMVELARCIEEHNSLTRQASDLWGQAQAESQRIGHLVEAVLSTGVSWSELGTLLITIDDAPPPAGLLASAPSGAAPATEKSEQRRAPNSESQIPTQRSGAGPRTLAETLMSDGAPALLRQAHSVVSSTREREMATPDLAVALGRNPNTLGPDLVALLRAVGVERPDNGKIRERYTGNGQQRRPGFTAACLRRALDAYATMAARMSDASADGDGGGHVGPASLGAATGR